MSDERIGRSPQKENTYSHEDCSCPVEMIHQLGVFCSVVQYVLLLSNTVPTLMAHYIIAGWHVTELKSASSAVSFAVQFKLCVYVASFFLAVLYSNRAYCTLHMKTRLQREKRMTMHCNPVRWQ